MFPVTDLTRVSPTLDCRSITFENPTGARGAGGAAAGGRKGASDREIAPGERVVIADIDGPGVIRHIWMTFHPARPEILRARFVEVFYDGADQPSISVPVTDFFGVPFGRPVHLETALTTISEGRGYNSYVPMPFRHSVRVEFVNASDRVCDLFFQIDYTLEPLDDEVGYLHVAFRRENPTVLKRDFVITEGLRGPGRFIGSVVGVRVLDPGFWYGEGEMKAYIDGDSALPTICGTGLEDYVGSAWGMGVHQTRYAGVPLLVQDHAGAARQPDFVGFYRWHIADPIMFARDLKVTIQQLGFDVFFAGEEERLRDTEAGGRGWFTSQPGAPLAVPDAWGDGEVIAMGIAERVDDYCATAFVMCAHPQAVPRITPELAVTAIERKPYEMPFTNEAFYEGTAP
jgi:hypothetical protein